jgi:hypothetical protein
MLMETEIASCGDTGWGKGRKSSFGNEKLAPNINIFAPERLYRQAVSRCCRQIAAQKPQQYLDFLTVLKSTLEAAHAQAAKVR